MKTAMDRYFEIDARLAGGVGVEERQRLRREREALLAGISPERAQELARLGEGAVRDAVFIEDQRRSAENTRLLTTLGAPALPADPFTGMAVARMEPEPHYMGCRTDTRAWVPGARRAPGQAAPLPKPFCYRCRREVDEWAVEPELVGGGVTMTARCHGAEEAQRLAGATLRGMTALLLHPAFAPAAPQTLGPREEPGPLSNLMASLRPRRRS